MIDVIFFAYLFHFQHLYGYNKTLKQEFSPLKLEYLRSISTGNLKLEDGFIEYLVSKNMKAQHIGEGHYPVDIKKDNKGIDVLCVCMNGQLFLAHGSRLTAHASRLIARSQ